MTTDHQTRTAIGAARAPRAASLPKAALGPLAALALAGVAALTATPVVASPQAAAGEPAAVRANRAADAFATRLREALGSQLKTAGPAAAVGFCRDEAPRIADSVMAEHRVRLGRIAVPGRQRNPEHAASGWQGDLLDGFAQAVAAGAPAAGQQQVQRDGLPAGVQLRMARSIAVEPPCLMCHGRVLADDVAAAISASYPDDAATGFELGDLRGALWVEVPTATP